MRTNEPMFGSESSVFNAILKKVWPEPDLNRRHKDFQSSALPTELSSQLFNIVSHGCLLRNGDQEANVILSL